LRKAGPFIFFQNPKNSSGKTTQNSHLWSFFCEKQAKKGQKRGKKSVGDFDDFQKSVKPRNFKARRDFELKSPTDFF
jgi:hypothetical protein